MKSKAVLVVAAIIASTPVRADTLQMQHSAFIRDEYGNALGIASEGDGVTVTGWDESGRVQIYDCNTGITGTIAPVYLYGGTDYQYDNPGYYSYERPGTYDGYYQEVDYDYTYEQYYTGAPTYNPEPQGYTDDYSYVYQEPVYEDYQTPVYTEPAYVEAEASAYQTGTWVDIDISAQTMSVWKDGQQVLTGYCVTGNMGTNDTPIGTHYILSKQENATLRGADYETNVSYWMPFTESGCGIHDATWRYDFSSGAYMGNGSHGCVNATYGMAKQVYDLVEPGTPVVVH